MNNPNYSYTLEENGDIDVVGDITLNVSGVEEFPSYIHFGTIDGNFSVININDLKKSEGVPHKVNGDFSIVGAKSRRTNKFNNTDGFPTEVTGVVTIDKCPKVKETTILKKGGFTRINDDVDDGEPELTDEQQQILDFASDLLSEEEYDALEEFFLSQN